jgi:hypothetical protein
VPITVNESTVSEFRAVHELLRVELDHLAAMTKDYPVVITFAGMRFVFESRKDVVDLIDKLGGALTAYQKAA